MGGLKNVEGASAPTFQRPCLGRKVAEFGVQPQKTVIEVGFRWLARFLDPPNLHFPKKKFFHSTLKQQSNKPHGVLRFKIKN